MTTHTKDAKDTKELTVEILAAASSMIDGPIVYGIALSPQAHSKLRAENWNTSPRMDDPFGTFAGAPYIVDSRLREKNEVYYDKEAWLKRVKEQNAFDSK
jgi:hypothetical protein